MRYKYELDFCYQNIGNYFYNNHLLSNEKSYVIEPRRVWASLGMVNNLVVKLLFDNIPNTRIPIPGKN